MGARNGTKDRLQRGAQVVVCVWMDIKGRPMDKVRLPSRTANSTPGDEIPEARESRLSRYCPLWLLVAPFVGFALAGRVLILGANGEDWELWKAAVLGSVLIAPFAVGAYS